jgi:hypothetical protein
MPTEAEKKEATRLAIQEIYTVLLGVRNSDDGGLVQDIKEIKGHLSRQNGRISKNRAMIVTLIAFLAGMGILDATVWHRLLGG